MTAATFYGIPVARVGTESLLDRITPYENSNRIPLTIIDAALPDAERDLASSIGTPSDDPGLVERLSPLVKAVGYCMQSRKHPQLRDEVAAWLAVHLVGQRPLLQTPPPDQPPPPRRQHGPRGDAAAQSDGAQGREEGQGCAVLTRSGDMGK